MVFMGFGVERDGETDELRGKWRHFSWKWAKNRANVKVKGTNFLGDSGERRETPEVELRSDEG